MGDKEFWKQCRRDYVPPLLPDGASVADKLAWLMKFRTNLRRRGLLTMYAEKAKQLDPAGLGFAGLSARDEEMIEKAYCQKLKELEQDGRLTVVRSKRKWRTVVRLRHGKPLADRTIRDMRDRRAQHVVDMDAVEAEEELERKREEAAQRRAEESRERMLQREGG